MTDSALFDQAIGILRRLREELRTAAADSPSAVRPSALQSWADTVDLAVADFVEIERRARYDTVLTLGAALVDITLDGRPAPAISPGRPNVCAVCRARGVEEVLERA